MTDGYFDLTQDATTGRQPITNAGRVAYNLRLDQDDLEDRKSRGPKDSLWPGLNTEDRSQWVLTRDICLAYKRRAGRRQGDGMMTVFSTLNGAGRAGQTHREFIESVSFAGLAGGQGAIFDTTGKNPRYPEFAGVLGGLMTVMNNGTDRISNGQKVYWDIPAPGSEDSYLSRRSPDRLTAVLRPYKPGSHKVTAKAVAEALRKPPSESNSSGRPVSEDAAIAFKRFAMQMTVNAFEALLSSGLVKLDEAALGTSDRAAAARVANAADWHDLTHNAREGHITRVARTLGCRNVRDPAGNSQVDMPHIAGKSLRRYICDLLTGDTALIRLEGGTVPSGDKGEILCNQKSSVADMIAGAATAESYITRRIVGTALTPAQPKKEFDMVLGHYMV